MLSVKTCCISDLLPSSLARSLTHSLTHSFFLFPASPVFQSGGNAEACEDEGSSGLRERFRLIQIRDACYHLLIYLKHKPRWIAHATSGLSQRRPPFGPTGEVLASGNNGASLPPLPPPPPPPPAATSQDQVCAKTSPSPPLSAAVPPSVRVVGAINGRWFSFSGFGFGGENSVARRATRAAFRELEGKRTNERERMWPRTAICGLPGPLPLPSFLPSFRRV